MFAKLNVETKMMHQYVLQLLLLPLSKATTNLHFQWDTLATMQYTFCFNASGPFSPAGEQVTMLILVDGCIFLFFLMG